MDLRQLQVFVRVLEASSFSRAAAQLNATQSTLSRHVAQLEADLGQRLLVRTGRGVEPTEAGRALHLHAAGLLSLAERAREDLRDMQASPRGRVVVGLPPRVAQMLTVPLVEAFRARFPNAVITIAEALSLTLREWLVASRIDLALLFDPPASPALEFRLLGREALMLVGPPGTAALPARVPISALADYPLVLPSSPHALRSLVDETARKCGTTIRVVAEVDSVNSVRLLVTRGVAYSVLPESALAGVQGRLRVARLGPPVIRNRLVLALARTRPQTRLLRETVQILERIDLLRRAS